ncbi:hypothetical protein HELRODRAFT_177179 [Helobdella robusta]|uniref:Caspase family p20 domain-containing protein n=1 Tax=Helobdella robusta TaxID=6412 RepID=T1FBB9_HELRO|nr:hypothetical protein HELRODRAFT_177179 [Helobdella robusta]ESN98297.1 hypothetical protein HELRODRAFT_177179 [Helobdella robusta]
MRQIGYLLDLLPRRGPKAYEGFIQALQSTGQTHAIEILEPDPKPLWGDEQAKAIAGKISNYCSVSVFMQTTFVDGELELINNDYLMKKSKYSTLNYALQCIYPVNKNYKNRVVIININFDNGNKARRDGSEKDFENLKELFGLMKYDVIGKTELSKKEMDEFIVEERSYLNTSNESHNVWIMIIMSHGTIGGCYDADGRLHAFSDIVNNFDGVNCPGLKGVPKIFIFQCCLGNKKSYPCGTLFNKCESASADYESSCTTAIPPINDRHDKADVIRLFSTVEEYVSIRNPELGCIYISAFIYVLSNMCRHENLQTMILRVSFHSTLVQIIK